MNILVSIIDSIVYNLYECTSNRNSEDLPRLDLEK